MTTTTLDVAGLNGGNVTLTSRQLDELDTLVRGQVLHSADPDWDDAVRVWNGMAAKLPALVVRPGSVGEVAAAVSFARDHGLLLSVKGGGHHIAGTSIANGGLTLDLRRMRDVHVDPDAKVAFVGPGCTLGELDRATQEHGLATPLGFISEVGVSGLTLGGGLGYLTRRFGWTVDNLEAVDIVTADGQICTASRERNAELFWGIRGAGANLGVVTRFVFQLHEVGPMVYGGLIAWPFERAEEILSTYRQITAEARRELAVWMLLTPAPPATFVPVEWHGKKICAMAVCHSGDLAAADAAVAPLRAIGQPIVDLIGPMPYSAVQSYLDDGEPKGMHYYWRTEYLAELSDELLSTSRELFADCPIPDADVGFLHIAGAVNDHAEHDGAVGNGEARYVLGVKGMWDPNEPRAEEFRQWVRRAGDRMRPYGTGRTYINFQTGDEGEDRVRATYGANYDRLVEIKKRYDPDNLFRSNRNIRE